MKTKKHFWNNAPVDTAFHLMNYFILIVILLVCAYPVSYTHLALKEEGQSKKAVYLIRAKARIEEANVQAVYRRETSAGAKFILQTEFGYADKEKIDPARLIEVKLVP